MSEATRLVVRRLIAASPARLYEAWTTASQLVAWWGPGGVRCKSAEVDARVGGRYRIENVLADGRIVLIAGEFLSVSPPRELVFTWSIEPDATSSERVTVRFEAHGAETEVVVLHERIPDEPTRAEHAAGWHGCLEGLGQFASGHSGFGR